MEHQQNGWEDGLHPFLLILAAHWLCPVVAMSVFSLTYLSIYIYIVLDLLHKFVVFHQTQFPNKLCKRPAHTDWGFCFLTRKSRHRCTVGWLWGFSEFIYPLQRKWLYYISVWRIVRAMIAFLTILTIIRIITTWPRFLCVQTLTSPPSCSPSLFISFSQQGSQSMTHPSKCVWELHFQMTSQE